MNSLFNEYTAQIMQYNLGASTRAGCTACTLSNAEIGHHANRVGKLLAESGRVNLVLFGTGCPALVKLLSAQFAQTETKLYFCELNIERTRELLLETGWEALPENTSLICDTSPRAVIALLAAANVNVENSVFYLCPGLPEAETKSLQKCMQLLQRSRAVPTSTAPAAVASEQISILAILHPEETGLAGFCAQIPNGIKELVIVWDSPRAHMVPLEAACPIIQSNRELDGDFASQRNHALSLCSAPWVLALDGDERLDENGWQNIKEAASQDEISAFFLQRPTFFPDSEHFRIGFGLWPDYQLRLFKHTNKTLFTRPVHEILIGVAGCTAILQHAPLWHWSYVLKDRSALEERLKVFNKAMGKPVHRLNRDYPHLPLSWFESYQKLAANLKYLVLPE